MGESMQREAPKHVHSRTLLQLAQYKHLHWWWAILARDSLSELVCKFSAGVDAPHSPDTGYIACFVHWSYLNIYTTSHYSHPTFAGGHHSSSCWSPNRLPCSCCGSLSANWSSRHSWGGLPGLWGGTHCTCSRARALHAANVWSSYKPFWWHLADYKTIQIYYVPYQEGLWSEIMIKLKLELTTLNHSLSSMYYFNNSTDCSYSALSGTTTRTLLSLTVTVHTSNWTTIVLKFAF